MTGKDGDPLLGVVVGGAVFVAGVPWPRVYSVKFARKGVVGSIQRQDN
jgi:hypothetical protein